MRVLNLFHTFTEERSDSYIYSCPLIDHNLLQWLKLSAEDLNTLLKGDSPTSPRSGGFKRTLKRTPFFTIGAKHALNGGLGMMYD